MPLSKQNQLSSTTTRDFKHRVLTLLQKLSDRDTHSSAATELESLTTTIASLSHHTLPFFLSSITTTTTSSSSSVHKTCLHLISLLLQSHPPSLLSPHLPKLLSFLLRLLRHPDSSVRSSCISTASSLSSHLTNTPFSSLAKPFFDALVTEQDSNAQVTAALCLANIIDVSNDVDVGYLSKVMVRFERLVMKCEGFKAKAAVVTLMGSVVGVGGAVKSGNGEVRSGVVECLVESVKSEEWAVRKAAVEALIKLAVVERDGLSEFKAECLKTFEAKRFDKVKIVRETMNQMVEVWKEIPDLSDEISPPPFDSESCSKDVASDGRCPPGSKISGTTGCGAPQTKKKTVLTDKSPLPDAASATTTRRRTLLDSSEKKTDPAIFRKLDRKKPMDWKVEISGHHASWGTVVGEDDPERGEETELEKGDKDRNRFKKTETTRSLFNTKSNDRMHKLGGSKAGSRVVPCDDEISESTLVVSNVTEDLCINQKESEELSLIRKQLMQIENQQSNLLDLLQRFIGSSQNGMHSLETRVHGLELTLDEISYDLSMSTGRMSNPDAAAMCCKLPGAEFLSSRLWGRTEGRHSTSRISSSGTLSVAAIRNIADRNMKMKNRRFRLKGGGGGGGFIVNPLADINSDSHGISEVSSKKNSDHVS